MGQVKAGVLIDPENGEILSNVESVLTGYGITLRDSNSEFRNFGDVLDEVAGKWDTFGTVAKHAIATAFAGTRNQDKFLILLSQYKNALKYEDIAAGSDGTAQKKFSEAYLGGVEAHVNTLKAAYESLSMTVLNSDTVNGILTTGTAIVSIFDKVIQVAGIMPTLAGGVGAFLGFSGQGLFSGVNPFERNWLTAADKSKVGDVNSWLATQMQAPGADLSKIKQSKEWIDQLNSLPTEKARQFAMALDGTEYSMRNVMTLGQSFVHTIKSIGSAMLTSGAYALAMFAVSKGIEAISNAYNQESIALEDLQKKADTAKQTQDDLAAKKNEQAAIQKQLTELGKVEFQTIAQQSQTEELRMQNAELERQIILLGQRAKKEADDAATASKTAWANANKPNYYTDTGYKLTGGQQFELELMGQLAVDHFQDLQAKTGEAVSSRFNVSDVEAATSAMKLYTGAVEQKNRLLAQTSRTDGEEAQLQSLESRIANLQANLITLGDDVFSVIDTPESQAMLDRITYTLGNYEERVSVFGNSLSVAVGDKQKEKLIALAGAGKLTEESLSAMVGDDVVSGFNDLTGGIDQTLNLIQAIARESELTTSSVTSVGTGLSASFETVKTSVTNLSAQYTALSAAQKQQATDGYLTIDTLNALADAGIEYRDSVEYVASSVAGQTGTYRVNLDTLAQTVEANNQYERGLIELKKAASMEEIRKLKDKTEDLTDADKEALAVAEERVALYEELSKGLDNMSAASTAYKVAIETANASADYDYGTGTIFKTITDGLTSGRIATDEFKAAMGFFTDGELVDSFTQENIPAIQAFADAIAPFTQGGAAGLNAATAKFSAASLLDSDGNFKDGTTLEMAAAALGENVGTEFTYSLLKSYEDYGFDVNLEKLMQEEDWQMVADMMDEQAKPLLNTYAKLDQLYAQDPQNKDVGIQNQIRNIMNTLSVDDLNKAISDYQTAIDSGKFKGPALARLQKGQGNLNLLLDEKQVFDSTVEMSVTDNATPTLESIIRFLGQIHSKNVVVGVSFKLGNAIPEVISDGSVTNPNAYQYTQPLTAYGYGGASGNANAGGTWGRGSGGRTLVGELGPEIVVDPATNRWYTVGDRGAQFANLPQNAIVFNHLQTQSILSQGRLGSRGKALVGGSAAYNRFKDDSDVTFGSFGSQYMVTSDGGISPIPGAPSKPGKGKPTQEAVSLSEAYKKEIELLELKKDLTEDLLNMEDSGSEKWLAQQQLIIDSRKQGVALAQAEYDRLIASGADINNKDVQDVLKQLSTYKKEVFDASKEYGKAKYEREIELLETQKALTEDLLNLYESGSDKWFTQQQRMIDTYKQEAILAKAEYDRLVASGADIGSEAVQSVLSDLVGYRKEIFDASQEYWEAEKDNANSTLEHMKAQAQAVMDLQESYHDLTKSIQAEQRSIDSELRIASEAYPNLTTSEREAAFSGDDYRLLSNRLAVIAAEAANMQADYMQQIKDVGEESSYELESITDEFQKQYELKLDAYNIAKNELAVLKAKKNLENVQSERSVAMLIGGMWTWVADAEAVADAMRGVTDAQQELADAQSDATFNAEQANISGVINQIDNQIGAIDALVYSSDALAEEVHSLVATIQDQVLAAMSPSSAAMLASLPMYAGTSTGLFGTSSLQSLLAASLASSGAAFAPMSSLGVDLSSILGNMGSVRPSISVSSSPTGDIVSIGQLTITGAVASQFIALLRSVAPLG